jgi:hypothetical protein
MTTTGLIGKWIVKFDDQEQSAEDGEIIAEIGNDFVMVQMRNVAADGSPPSSVLFQIADLTGENIRWFDDGQQGRKQEGRCRSVYR